MTISTRLVLLSNLNFSLSALAAYSPVRDFSGGSFFNHWNFIDVTDNGLTNGDVQFLGRSDATSQRLAFTNGAGNAVIKVDNSSTVVWDNKRNSIRLESLEAFPVGSLVLIDVAHMPFGCSVWPAFWTRGIGGEWPSVGEIDIIEGVNRRTFNQMALHTSPGCTQADGAVQSGASTNRDCAREAGVPGCVVEERQPASYGTDFNAAGGGVFATQFDTSGIFIWFFSRPNVPEGIRTNATSLDTSTWGNPSASWPSSSCTIENHFTPQQLILDITLCGDFATPTYNDTCGAPKKNCYEDNVLGNGTNYNDAFFEIPFVRVYSANPSIVPSSLSAGSAPTSSASGSSPTNSPGSSNSGNTTNNSALASSFLGSSNLILAFLASIVTFSGLVL